jgi:hypothetical protein
MSRTLLSIPSVSDTLSVYSNINEIAECLGASLEQGDEPDILFSKGNAICLLCGLSWHSKEERKFFIIEKTKGSWRFENEAREIGELRSANKAIADRCNRLEKERDNALLKAEESVSKDLFLEAISAATGRELKRND